MGSPRRSRSARLLQGLGLLLTLGVSASALQGCGKQGEGERCDRNNGRLDCESGLFCREIDPGVTLCCPPVEATTSVDACRSGGTELPEDLDPVAEPEDAAAPESPADSGT